MRFGIAILTLIFTVLPAFAQASGAAAVKPRRVEASTSSGGKFVVLNGSSDLLGAPFLGYATRSGVAGVYPLNGIPGAAFPGATMMLIQAHGRPVISSVAGYALAAGKQPGELLLYGLRPRSASGQLAPSTLRLQTQADQIAVSPLGHAALLYDRGRKKIEMFVGLPGRPVSQFTSSLEGMPGVLTALAVADDGTVALAAFSSGDGSGQIYAFRRDAAPSPSGAVSRVVHIAFVPSSRDALAADYDGNQVLILRNAGREGVQSLADSHSGLRNPTAVEASTGGDVYVISEGANSVLVLSSAQPGASSVIACGCATAVLERMRNPDSFKLTAGRGPIAILDRGGNQSDVFFIPAGDDPGAQPADDLAPIRNRRR